MTQERIDVESTDTLPVGRGTINANAAKNQALQKVVGVQDAIETLGTISGDATAGDAGDTVKLRVDKHENRLLTIEAGGLAETMSRHSAEIDRRDKALNDNFDYQDAVEGDLGVLGTTRILDAQLVTDGKYPRLDTYQVSVTTSAAVTGATAGKYRTAIISNGLFAWVSVCLNGTWTALQRLGGGSFVRTADVGDWVDDGDTYKYTVTEADHDLGTSIAVTMQEITGSSPAVRTPWNGAYSFQDDTPDVIVRCSKTPDARAKVRIIIESH